MNLNKKNQIFISSTYIDLKEARSRVTEKVLSMYQFPIGMEMFSAGNDDQWTVIKRTIDISDYYVLIIGHRYGSTTPEGISYTEKEFNYAVEKGIPVLAFIRDRNIPTTPMERENDPISQQKLDLFIKKVKDMFLCEFWTDEKDLSAKVSVALMKAFVSNPRAGWIRADSDKNVHNNLDINEISLEQSIVNYLDDRRRYGLKELTINGYQLELKLFLEYFKEMKISQIDTNEIKNFLRFREDNYGINSKNSMERIRGIIKVYFDWLVEENLVKNNPVKKIKPYKQAEGTKESLDEIEIQEIISACNTLRDRALIEVLLSTGCKLGELQKIKLKHINWRENTITIEGGDTKNRVVLLTQQARYHLEKYIKSKDDGTDFLFVTERKPYRPLSSRGIQRTIKEIIKKTNINKQVSPSTFRHTFAQRMINEGYPTHVIQSLLGNSEHTSFSDTYIHVTNENIHNLLKVKK